MGFFTTVYLTGLLVSIVWLCLSEIKNPHKRFALAVGWPLVMVYGAYEFVMYLMEVLDAIDKGDLDLRQYLSELVLGDYDEDHVCCDHDHDHDTDDAETPVKKTKKS